MLDMINRGTDVIMAPSYKYIYTSDRFRTLPDLIGPSSSKPDSFKNNKNKIPEPSNRCFQMFRFIFMKVL